MKPFDLLSAPLAGIHLIEAGAGTGKTFTITGLYLRLIVEQGLSVDHILVVTYTKAATEELKSRIRRRLLFAKACLAHTGDPDPLIETVVQNGIAPHAALQRIQDALIDFDRAAIYTIHGFCQRVLQHFAFETGHLFSAELVQDDRPLIQEVADDFWRRKIGRAPIELVRYVTKHAKGPEDLAALCQQCRFALIRVVPSPRKPPLTAIHPWRKVAAQIVALWSSAREPVIRLLSSEGLNAVQYGKCAQGTQAPDKNRRHMIVSGLIAAMDRWTGDYPLFDRFDRFSQACVAKATKKKFAVPEHPFFTLCDQALACQLEMERQLSDYWRYLKVRLLDELRQRLDQKKARDNILFFDDLLTQVYAALQGDQRDGLVQAIQNQYQAALVDEFQDTDALQYEIFTRLFDGRRSLLFMIGDPKQAIYSFRGADLFSYLRAKTQAPSHFTLTRNWRATPALIAALNTLFGNRARPFGYEQIPYERAVAANETREFDSAPFHLWVLNRTDEDGILRAISQQDAVNEIVAAVAERIVVLLSGAAPGCAPESIAVLTRTHRQAQLMKRALARRHVPAVLHSAGSVYTSPEAADLALVLKAAALPGDPRNVRAALASDLFGVGAQALCASVEDIPENWQSRWSLFEQYHRLWQRFGFYRMFSRMMAEEGMRSRLLALPDGERRLTNVLHLAELLHQASVAQQLGPEGLVKWFARRRREEGGNDDEQKLRLESDAHAVRIITIHKSKGLQFDIVFCPFTWTGVKVDDKVIAFHDPDHQDQLTLAIGPGILAQHRKMALEEALAENLRLMYVALTRARKSCYWLWGTIKGSELSAPAYLLHHPQESGDRGDWTAGLKNKMAGMTQTQMMAELEALAQASGGTIRIEAPPKPSSVPYAQTSRQEVALSQREFSRVIDTSWRIASFSAMSALSSESNERPDRDAFESVRPQPGRSGGGAENLFAFPKGVQAGLFFHDLLEHWDPAGRDAEQRRLLTEAKLRVHRFNEAAWGAAVDRMLVRLSQVRLPVCAEAKAFTLADVASENRINEMEFYFPLKRVHSEQLKQVFKNTGPSIVADSLGRLTFAPMEGFLKGYIDTVILHGGRYYLLDWKSNHLGDAWDDYDMPHLNAVMGEAFYFLQSHLYALALDRLLRQQIAGYRYEQHFGGIYYLFLRGIQGAHAATGIHYMVPEAGLMSELKNILLEETGAASPPHSVS